MIEKSKRCELKLMIYSEEFREEILRLFDETGVRKVDLYPLITQDSGSFKEPLK